MDRSVGGLQSIIFFQNFTTSCSIGYVECACIGGSGRGNERTEGTKVHVHRIVSFNLSKNLHCLIFWIKRAQKICVFFYTTKLKNAPHVLLPLHMRWMEASLSSSSQLLHHPLQFFYDCTRHDCLFLDSYHSHHHSRL